MWFVGTIDVWHHEEELCSAANTRLYEFGESCEEVIARVGVSCESVDLYDSDHSECGTFCDMCGSSSGSTAGQETPDEAVSAPPAPPAPPAQPEPPAPPAQPELPAPPCPDGCEGLAPDGFGPMGGEGKYEAEWSALWPTNITGCEWVMFRCAYPMGLVTNSHQFQRTCATGEEQCRSNGCNSLTLVNAGLASVPDWIGNFTGFGSGPTSPLVSFDDCAPADAGFDSIRSTVVEADAACRPCSCRGPRAYACPSNLDGCRTGWAGPGCEHCLTTVPGWDPDRAPDCDARYGSSSRLVVKTNAEGECITDPCAPEATPYYFVESYLDMVDKMAACRESVPPGVDIQGVGILPTISEESFVEGVFPLGFVSL
jgi:hypothetical protein